MKKNFWCTSKADVKGQPIALLGRSMAGSMKKQKDTQWLALSIHPYTNTTIEWWLPVQNIYYLFFSDYIRATQEFVTVKGGVGNSSFRSGPKISEAPQFLSTYLRKIKSDRLISSLIEYHACWMCVRECKCVHLCKFVPKEIRSDKKDYEFFDEKFQIRTIHRYTRKSVRFGMSFFSFATF